MSKRIKIGILISTTGSYGTVGKTIVNGVLLASKEILALHPDLKIELVKCNPDGQNINYSQAAEKLLQDGIKNIIGCYTSSSRKEILPLMEQYEGLLWYPTHYEGFENSENVIYTGTSPNHHIYPLVDFMHSNYGGTAFCIGSDYIWAWETNRVFADIFKRQGGAILGEEYLPIDSDDMDVTIAQILKLQPSFILNTLVGASSYHFFRKIRQASTKSRTTKDLKIPIVSCNLSEADLEEIGPEAADGHYSSSVYFSTVDTPENKKFVKEYKKNFPHECLPTVEAEAAYIATHIMIAALRQCNVDERNNIEKIKNAAIGYEFYAPQGLVMLDPINYHTYLTPRIGRSTKNGTFDIVTQATAPVRPDPYLIEEYNFSGLWERKAKEGAT